MKKIILTEEQVKSLMSNVIKEQVPAVKTDEYEITDGRYQVKCIFSFDVDDYTTYKNGEIDDIADGVGTISYLLDIDHQPYGIQSIRVKDIKYPPTIDTTVTYGQRQVEGVKIQIDWRRTKTYSWDDDTQIDYIGVGKRVTVTVKPDGNGGIVGYVDEIDIRELKGEDSN